MQTKTDPRSATVTHLYDDVDRLAKKQYNAVGCVASTPDATFSYDTADSTWNICPSSPRIGRLISVSSSVSSTKIDCYDALGRARNSLQTTGSVTATMAYFYSPGGSLTKQVLPSGRVVTTTVDDLGRPTLMTGSFSGFAKNYASSVTYRANGQRSQVQWPITPSGNSTVGFSFHNLQQLSGITFTGAQSWTASMSYDRTTNCPANAAQCNNGNLMSATLQGRAQTYTYDAINRLKTAGEGSSWSQTFVYDASGNRAVVLGPNTDGATPTVASPYFS